MLEEEKVRELDKRTKPSKESRRGSNIVIFFAGISMFVILYVVINNRNSEKTAHYPGEYSSTNSGQPTSLSNVATISTPLPTTLPTIAPTPAPTPITFKLGDKVAVGKLGISAVSMKTAVAIEHIKTDNLFVVIKCVISNNDIKARDVSTNMFTLMDGEGKTYEAYDITFSDQFLYYETINPGLSRTRLIVFETPVGINNLSLIADSGVAFAGGEPVTISLGQ